MAIHYYPLINKVINTLQLRDKLSFLSTQSPEEAFSRPFITIAREPGSGGAPIARAVADKLGFECIDEQIVDEIAHSTKQRKALIQQIDEKNRTMIDDLVHSMLNKDYVDDIKYVTELVKIILSYAHKGNVVLIGRGANFVTPFSKGLHVNITAPYAVRVERAVQFEGITEAKAKEIIALTETERKDFVKQYFGKDIKKCNAYDLTINTSYFEFKQVRDLIIEAFYQKFSRTERYVGILKT